MHNIPNNVVDPETCSLRAMSTGVADLAEIGNDLSPSQSIESNTQAEMSDEKDAEEEEVESEILQVQPPVEPDGDQHWPHSPAMSLCSKAEMSICDYVLGFRREGDSLSSDSDWEGGVFIGFTPVDLEAAAVTRASGCNIIVSVLIAMRDALRIEDLETTFIPARRNFLLYSWFKIADSLSMGCLDTEDQYKVISTLLSSSKTWSAHCSLYEEAFVEMYGFIATALKDVEALFDAEVEDLSLCHDNAICWLTEHLAPRMKEVYQRYYCAEKGLNNEFSLWCTQMDRLWKILESRTPALLKVLSYPHGCQPVWDPFPPGTPYGLPQMPRRIPIPEGPQIEKSLAAGRDAVAHGSHIFDIFGHK
jgi:hypothetical protein